jgi:hypothetical protein
MTSLPTGYSWKLWPGAKSGRTREAWIVTAPNGTRVSFYEDGGVRVYRPDHDVQISTANRDKSGTSVDIEFAPRS